MICNNLKHQYITLLALMLATSIGHGKGLDIFVMFKNDIVKVKDISFDKGVFSADVITDPEICKILNKYGCIGIKVAADGPVDTIAFAADGTIIKMLDLSKVFRLSFENDLIDRDKIISELRNSNAVVFAEKQGRYELYIIPNDDEFYKQWGLNNSNDCDIDAPEAWNIYTGDSWVRIGILDTGVKQDHPDFVGKISGDGPDGHWHGTHVAGIAAAASNNGIGVAGVSWGSHIYSRRLDNEDEIQMYNCIIDAVNQGCWVLNNSWGGLDYSTIIRNAFSYAYKKNRVAVVAMGNNNTTTPMYPAAFGQGIIAVGATDEYDERASYSNKGNHIDVVAPGGYEKGDAGLYNNRCIYSTMSPFPPYYNLYDYAGGTSMATPFVTGLAALLKGYNQNLSNDDIEQIIRLSADDKGPAGWDQEYGTGRINARRALEMLGPNYCLNQWSASGGSDVGSSSLVSMAFYSVPGLADGWYLAYRHEIKKSITFPLAYNVTPTVWGRGCGSNGYNADVSNHALPFTEVVPGTVSKTGCQLRTYIYKVYNTAGQYVGWYPFENPANAVFQYTAFIPYTAPSNATISGYYEPQPSSKAPVGYIHLSWGCTQGTIQAKYTLQIMEPYSPTGTWSTMFTTTATSYSYQHLPHSSGTGYRIIAYDGKTSISSNAVIIKQPVPGDPIVATVQNPEATAYSNGRKIILDDDGKLHVTYTSGDNVYYTTSADQGQTWTPGQAVALGQNPALALRADGTPLLCWNQGSCVYTAEKDDGGWGGAQLVYAGSPGEEISYLSFVADPSTGKTYSGWVGSVGGQSQVLVAERTPGSSIQPAPERLDFGEVAFKSPCLALKRDGTLINAWSRDGVVRFREGGGAIMELSQPGRHCIHPVVEAYGDRVTVVWQEEEDTSTPLGDHLEPGRHRIVSRTRTEFGWGEERVIAQSDQGDYQYPVAAAAGQYLYAGHHGDGNYDVHYLGDYADGWETHTRNITLNSGGQSGYPCVAFSNRWPNHSLYILWTESFPDSAKGIIDPPLVKDYLDVIQPVPSFEVYPRSEQASQYCTQRAGGLCYGASAYRTVDYHPEELKYRFSGLNKDNKYKIKMVFYRSTGGGANPSHDWILQPRCDQVSFGTVHLPDTTVVTLEREIPRHCLNDGTVEITVRKIKGDYAVCAALEIIEYTTGKGEKAGGIQEAESGPNTLSYRYELLPSVPNPFNRTTAIGYQLAKPGKVSLKVYNTLGQLVRTLEDGEKQAGHHRVNWDGRDQSGQKAANGIYLYRLESGEFGQTRKMTLVR